MTASLAPQFVFLLEEPSMKVFLDGLLPRIIPSSIDVQTIPHEGKSDLEASIPRKLKGWRRPGARFFILRDQDAADCGAVKTRLCSLVAATGRSHVCVRIVCRELESWLLSDLKALADVFENPSLANLGASERFRNPDTIGNPLQELRRIVPRYQKVSGARRVGPQLDPSRSSSVSFRFFLAAVQAAVADVGSSSKVVSG
jgi:hypothetical protein